jgi:hypothetical protein
MGDALFDDSFPVPADAGASLAKMRSWFEAGMLERFQPVTLPQETL